LEAPHRGMLTEKTPQRIKCKAGWWELCTLSAVSTAKAGPRVQFNEHLDHDDGETVFRHACKMGLEGIVSKRKDSPYRSGRSPDWRKSKNPDAPAMKREAEEDWS
jgi:ATP-dependent DNA ligase